MADFTEGQISDKYLVERALGKDPLAFAAIIKNTERLVTGIVFKMVDNPADRKDIAQDIYLKAYQKLSGFKFQSKLSTWIGRISYNTCLDYRRKRKLEVVSALADQNETEEEWENNNSEALYGKTMATAEMMLMQKHLSEMLSIEIDKLSPVFKTLITLYHQEELSYAEIAQITSLPEGTVKNYLFRARRTLKNNLVVNFKKEDLW